MLRSPSLPLFLTLLSLSAVSGAAQPLDCGTTLVEPAWTWEAPSAWSDGTWPAAPKSAHADGTDPTIFSADEGRRIKRMPCVTSAREVVFVENDGVTWDGAGRLASIQLRRNLHSHRAITRTEDGLFHSFQGQVFPFDHRG